MKLYNTETGEEWEGEPIDARAMLDRGGWSEKPMPKEEPAVVAQEPEKPKRGRKKA
jgi:hypothetical protein